jgi:hypothetical protein
VSEQAPEQQQQQQPEELDYTPEPLAPEVEAEYSRTLKSVDPAVGAAIENVLVDPTFDKIPDNLLDSVAKAHRTDRDGALQIIAKAASPFFHQASQTVDGFVGLGQSAEVFHWAKTDPKGKELLKKAGRAQMHKRDLSGYRELAAGYLAHIAEKDPEAVAQGIRNGGGKARVVGKQVIVDLPGHGETEFLAAVRSQLMWKKKGRK